MQAFPDQSWGIVKTFVEPLESRAPAARRTASAPPDCSRTQDPERRGSELSERILANGLVTLMIRGLPTRSSVQDLFAHLDALGFRGRYDYVHFPPDERRPVHRDYAFVSFAASQQCARCADKIVGTQLPGASAKATLAAEVAKQQGVEANLHVLPGTHRRHARREEYLPWLRTGDTMKPCFYYVW